MRKIEKLVEMLKNNTNASFEGKKSEDLIKSAEQFLDIIFPEDYRYFLKELGCGDLNGKEVYGLISNEFENSSIPNMVWLTKERRKEFKVYKDFLFIASSDEYDFIIDTRDSSVAEWYPDGNINKVFVSFTDFLEKVIMS